MALESKDPVAFVPTMGALHAGHESLIKIAQEKSNQVVVSIFVNPLQFESQEDLANYPRTPELDIKIAERAGATKVWLPTFEEIYPQDPEIIPAGPIGDVFEGVHRFGHFDGVLTVVKRLFDLINPKFAVFGEKDFQQLFLIRQMVAKYKLPVEIIAAPIIREADGLALSSRNIRLSAKGRKSALVISQALRKGGQDLAEIKKILASESGFTLDYAEVIDAQTFERASADTSIKRVIIAGWVEGVRLLDNA